MTGIQKYKVLVLPFKKGSRTVRIKVELDVVIDAHSDEPFESDFDYLMEQYRLEILKNSVCLDKN